MRAFAEKTRRVGTALAFLGWFNVAGALRGSGSEQTSDEAQHAFVETPSPEIATSPREVEDTPDALVLHYEQPGATKTTERRIPGDVVETGGSVQFVWGSHDFKKVDAEQTERELLKQQVDQMVDSYLASYEEMEVAPERFISGLEVAIDAYSSPEGWRLPKQNQTLSEKRAALTEQLVRETLNERGLTQTPVKITRVGHGAEGDLTELSFALHTKLGAKINEGSKAAVRDNAERIVAAIHDGRTQEIIKLVPEAKGHLDELGDIYQETVAAHRHADIRLKFQTKDIIVRTDPGSTMVIPDVPQAPAHDIPFELIIPIFLPFALRRKRRGDEEETEQAPEGIKKTPLATPIVQTSTTNAEPNPVGAAPEQQPTSPLGSPLTPPAEPAIAQQPTAYVETPTDRPVTTPSATPTGRQTFSPGEINWQAVPPGTSPFDQRTGSPTGQYTGRPLPPTIDRPTASPIAQPGEHPTLPTSELPIDVVTTTGTIPTRGPTRPTSPPIETRGTPPTRPPGGRKHVPPTLPPQPPPQPPPPPPRTKKTAMRIPASVKKYVDVKFQPYVKHIGTRGAGMRRGGLAGRL